jgi:hypothetical protein
MLYNDALLIIFPPLQTCKKLESFRQQILGEGEGLGMEKGPPLAWAVFNWLIIIKYMVKKSFPFFWMITLHVVCVLSWLTDITTLKFFSTPPLSHYTILDGGRWMLNFQFASLGSIHGMSHSETAISRGIRSCCCLPPHFCVLQLSNWMLYLFPNTHKLLCWMKIHKKQVDLIVQGSK